MSMNIKYLHNVFLQLFTGFIVDFLMGVFLAYSQDIEAKLVLYNIVNFGQLCMQRAFPNNPSFYPTLLLIILSIFIGKFFKANNAFIFSKLHHILPYTHRSPINICFLISPANFYFLPALCSLIKKNALNSIINSQFHTNCKKKRNFH